MKEAQFEDLEKACYVHMTYVAIFQMGLQFQVH